MKKNNTTDSFLKIGSVCAILVSAFYLAIVVLALFSPKSVITYQASEQYFKDFQYYENFFISLKILMVLANTAMIGVIIALYIVKPKKHKSYLAFFSILAFIGLGIGMLQGIEDATQVPHLAKSYQEANSETKKVILTFGVANPAIYSLSLGLVGIWFFVVSAVFKKVFSKPLFYLSILWGMGNVLTVIAHLFILTWLIYFIEAGALIAAPAWGYFLAKFFWEKRKA